MIWEYLIHDDTGTGLDRPASVKVPYKIPPKRQLSFESELLT